MKILVIGGYGNFGKRLVKRLLLNPSYRLIIGGRSESKAQQFIQSLSPSERQRIEFIKLDILNDELVPLFKKLTPSVVANASGPYQDQHGNNNYRVARACIECHSTSRCHYLDLADAREYVSEFNSQLDSAAKLAKCMLVTGASTVPGLTAAVIDEYSPRFSAIRSICYSISPGNKTDRGKGTVASILSYTGKPFTTLIKGKDKIVYGWQGIERSDFTPPLGKRWLGYCNIPDLDLLRTRYPTLESIQFKAGLEVTLLHGGLWLLSWASRFGIFPNLTCFASSLTKISHWFKRFGNDAGGMSVVLHGIDDQGKPKAIHWQLVAEDGVGPNVPVIAAELVIKRIASGQIIPGAMPCVGLFTLQEFFEVAAYWNIYQRELPYDKNAPASRAKFTPHLPVASRQRKLE